MLYTSVVIVPVIVKFEIETLVPLILEHNILAPAVLVILPVIFVFYIKTLS